MSLKKIKSINALGVKFKVVRRRCNSQGKCCPVDFKITINPDAKNLQNTIIHESVHGAIFSGGIFEALEGNEKIIEVICEQVARVMDENFIIIPRESTLGR